MANLANIAASITAGYSEAVNDKGASFGANRLELDEAKRALHPLEGKRIMLEARIKGLEQTVAEGEAKNARLEASLALSIRAPGAALPFVASCRSEAPVGDWSDSACQSNRSSFPFAQRGWQAGDRGSHSCRRRLRRRDWSLD
jgi:hypothetical protein